MQGESELAELQAWYEAQCDGDWEHEFGVRVGTLDNPGWTGEIDVAETPLEGRAFPAIDRVAAGPAWMKCWVSEGKFRGVGGPLTLGRILRAFLDWAREAGPAESAAPAV